MNRGLGYWLRWIILLPVSFIAAILVDFPVHWVLYNTLSGGESPFITPYPETPELVLVPFFRALTLVWVSSQVAPEYKFKSSIVLSTFWVFMAGFTFALGYFGVSIGTTKLNLTAGGLPVVMGVVGALTGLYFVRKRLTSDKQEK